MLSFWGRLFSKRTGYASICQLKFTQRWRQLTAVWLVTRHIVIVTMLYVITCMKCKWIITDKVHEIIVCKCVSCSAWYCKTTTCKIHVTCQYSIFSNTCTQKLQSFHKVKQFHGSPLKAGKFGSIISRNKSGKKTVFDPRPDTKPTVQNYHNFAQNLTVNYKAYHPGSKPLAQLYSPANIHALESDHDYCEHILSDLFLNEIGVTTICLNHQVITYSYSVVPYYIRSHLLPTSITF